MPRLSSITSRSLAGIGLSPSIPPITGRTFGLSPSDVYTAWYIPEDIGSANFTVAQGDIVQGSDAFGPWARTGTANALLAATVPSTTPTSFTAIIKCRLVSATLLADLEIFFRGPTVFTQREGIGYSSAFSRRGLYYTAGDGSGSSGINVDGALDGNPHVIIVLRQRDSTETVNFDIFNLNTGTLVYRGSDNWRTNLATASLMVFGLGSPSQPIQFYEGATFDRYISNAKLDSIFGLPLQAVPAALPSNQSLGSPLNYNGEGPSFITTPTVNSTTQFFTSNGTDWNALTLPQPYITQGGNTAFFNGFYYAFVRSSSSVFTRDLYRTSNFINWTLVWATGRNSNWRLDVNPDTGRMLATAGLNTAFSGTSADGSTWTLNSLPANATNLRNNKGWNGSVVVAANASNSTDFLYRSTDNGATWTSVANSTNWTVPAGPFTQSVAYGNGKFIALSGQGYRSLSISTDNGVTWPQLAENATLALGANSITFSRLKNKFIITNGLFNGSGGNNISVSIDGVSWLTVATQAEIIASVIETDLRIYATLASGTIVDITDSI
jgi:hypothetical protein